MIRPKGHAPGALRALSTVVVCVSFAACLAAPVHAQTPSSSKDSADYVEPTEEQARLNDQGVRALSEEDYVKAISLLEEARFLGELNITYLNLGRAYQLAGRCEKAREALQKVNEAPKVAKPPPGLVESRAQEYLSVLESTCKSSRRSGSGGAGAAGTSSSKTAGSVTTSIGGVMLASAVGMHFLWAEGIRRDATDGLSTDEVVTDTTQRDFYRARDRANTVDSAALVTGVAGGIATGVGLYFWLSASGPESASSVLVTPSADGVRATWTLRF